MENYIKGKYRKNIFTSEDGYTVGIFKVLETDIAELVDYIGRTITCTGYFHELNEIETYIFYGTVVTHSKYGNQFQVGKYEISKPVEKDAIIDFLSSGIFKGIGEKKAKKIAKVLGKDTLQIILEQPSDLLLIPSITKKDVDVLHNGLLEYESSYETILYLNKIGFSTKDSVKIYNKYHKETISKIEDNIYTLIDDIQNMSFKKIDYIAQKLNISKDANIRIDASIIYIMKELSNTYGHCYFKYEDIYRYIYRVLGVNISDTKFLERLNSLEKNLKIIEYSGNYYIREMFDAEKLIVSRFNLLSHQEDNKNDKLNEIIKQIESNFNISYNDSQKEAIKDSFIKNFLVITGGPGTGKTTILKAIIELYKMVNKSKKSQIEEDVALLAPTGRAAKRMSEATLFKASTIHRFLKWNKENDTFLINEYNKSTVKLVIVDESSMIDTYLFSNLLKGISVNTKIILIGDYDQLPSVGPGQVLYDIITSKTLKVDYLNKLYRQKEGSNIIELAYNIREGVFLKDICNVCEDLTFIECKSNMILENICEIAMTYKDVNYRDFQILAPMYKTINGIDNINQKLQSIFNPDSTEKKSLKIGDFIYREDDKVIQLTNQPDDNIYNGDIGIIQKIITGSKKEIYIDFDGNLVKYTPSNFTNFKLAYAISIHKSQGSEFDIVIIPIEKRFNRMLYRRLIYTAVTRCKKKLYLIGEYDAMQLAIDNISVDIRNTTIQDFLKNGINK